ncbi:MAG: GNAT family N-acetyltransferase [Sphingobacteriales bacterium]|nr:GNAT family N-acetyltransferase [Sphingobacteriales bacterium]
MTGNGGDIRKTVTDEYTFTRVTAAHYPLLTELYADAFGSRLTIEDIRKRYDTPAPGCEHIAFIALHTASLAPAAYYGVFPHLVFREHEKILVAQSGDTMTHSAHRKKGLFVTLARLTYAECEKKGIRYIYGFPNDNSLPGFLKHLQWKEVDQVTRYDLKLTFKTFPLSRLSKKSPLIRKWQLSLATRLLRKYRSTAVDSFHNPLTNGYYRVYRDSAYLRYKETPDKLFIRIEDITFWIRLTDVIWIGEMDNYHGITERIIRKLKRFAFWSGYNTIVLNLNESIPLPEPLKAFRPAGKDVSCFYLPDQKAPISLLITGADFDTW